MAHPDSTKGKALALLTANGGNVKKTAVAMGIPRQTLDRWARGQNVGRDARRSKQEAEEQLAQRFEQGALCCMDAITPDKYEESSLRDLTWAAAASVDKMRLLRGESTVIADKREQITILIAEIAERYDRPVNYICDLMVKLRPEVGIYVEREVNDGRR